MKIDSYDVKTASQRSFQQISYQSAKLVTKAGAGASLPSGMQAGAVEDAAAQADISDAAQKAMEDALGGKQDGEKKGVFQNGTTKASAMSKLADALSSFEDAKLSLLEQMIAALTGKEFKFKRFNPEAYEGKQPNFDPSKALTISQDGHARGADRTLFYAETESLQYEYESVSYQAQGVINTADGKSISIDLQLNMSREFMEYTHTSVKFEQLCDPIVVNFDGNASGLSGQKIEFDLDMDGSMDSISFAREGSGFLALDKNGDGAINDGSELFGPNSGNGFSELRAHDADGNGWIDENDAVFDQLLVWSKDADGNDVLYKLKDVNVGAIYLGETETEFSFKDSNNNTQGVMRSTSFFLKEDGSGAGTVSHIDLAL